MTTSGSTDHGTDPGTGRTAASPLNRLRTSVILSAPITAPMPKAPSMMRANRFMRGLGGGVVREDGRLGVFGGLIAGIWKKCGRGS